MPVTYLLACGHWRKAFADRNWYSGSWWCLRCGGRSRGALAYRMDGMISFQVFGDPVAQGSKVMVGKAKKFLVEGNRAKLNPWRQEVAAAAVAAMETGPWRGAVNVQMTFFLTRPKGHFGTGRNEGTLKASAPRRPAVKPDIDKLTRSVLDAMTGVVFVDDSQVVTCDAMKLYASDGQPPGVVVNVGPTA